MRFLLHSHPVRYALCGLIGISVLMSGILWIHSVGSVADSESDKPPKEGIACFTDDYCSSGKPTVEPNSRLAPAEQSNPGKGNGWGGEKPIPASPVQSCPLTSSGCAAANALLKTIEVRPGAELLQSLSLTFPIGTKHGRQIDDPETFLTALASARDHLGTIGVGCPQDNVLGPEEGACQDLCVIGIAIDLPEVGPTALGFEFVRHGDSFSLNNVVLDFAVDISRGGGSFGIAPALVNGDTDLWYTPWVR